MEHEYRMLLSSAEARHVVAAASAHLKLDVYDALQPVAFTRTTYFDTAAQELWGDEIGGASRRVRVRQYAASRLPESMPRFVGPAYLEYKQSVGTERRKLRYSSTPEKLRSLLNGGEIDANDLTRLHKAPEIYQVAMRIRSGELAPVLSTWYRRVSLSEGDLRLTIDENVAFCPPTRIGNVGEDAEPTKTANVISGRVVEIKLSGTMPRWLEDTITPLAGAESISKFRRGMESQLLPTTGSMNATRPLTILAPTREHR